MREHEPKIFQEIRAPQYPTGYRYESRLTKAHLRRRLMDSGNDVGIDLATESCADAAAHKKDFCVDDVMATGDLELAEDPFYNN